uniref:IQ domain-containing protein C isoform X1 n=1 Tax=Nyctereutes procyonoides TaxID=34880 RepID=UPI0024437BB3|nr:IQ domain-containing protein C isoform X1 [Nyctereutes procyonoides]
MELNQTDTGSVCFLPSLRRHPGKPPAPTPRRHRAPHTVARTRQLGGWIPSAGSASARGEPAAGRRASLREEQGCHGGGGGACARRGLVTQLVGARPAAGPWAPGWSGSGWCGASRRCRPASGASWSDATSRVFGLSMRLLYEKSRVIWARFSGQRAGFPGPNLSLRSDSPWFQDEHSRKARNVSQEEIRDTPSMENPEAAGPGLPYSPTELRELQYHHNHLAMELLWLQQAISSRKEYLILKQTLTSGPEVSRPRDKPSLCPDGRTQTCERAGSQRSPPPKNQSYKDRTTREPDYVGDCWRLKAQRHKSLERLATTDKTTAGNKYSDPCYRRAGPQLPTLSDNQALENRFAKELDCGEQTFGRTCPQWMTALDDHTPKGLKPRGSYSEKARTWVPTLCEDPDIEDKSPRGPEHREANRQSARPRKLDLSEDFGIWDETLAEYGGQDLWKTKPPKGQFPSDKSSRDRTSNEPSHEEGKNQRTVPWQSRPPEKLSSTGTLHMGKEGPPWGARGKTRFQRGVL